jgi:hypothetical protein
MPQPSIFNVSDYQAIVHRIEALQADAPRQWGKMTVSQMCEHVARTVEMAAGINPVQQAWLGKLIGWIFFKDFSGENPFPKNSPTGPYLIVHGDPEFVTARDRLKVLVTRLHALGEAGVDGNIHGFFGRMSGAEWGATQWKHIDHHLRQFNA